MRNTFRMFFLVILALCVFALIAIMPIVASGPRVA